MLRKLLISTAVVAAAVCAGATAALAADLPPPAEPAYKAPPVPIAVFDWTGFYIGVNLGYGFGSGSLNAGGITGSENLNGVLGGGQLGYNWQSGNWVFGLEIDGQGTDQKANFAATAGAVTVTESDKLPWFVTARGRIGYTVTPMVMIYATAGGAIADFQSTITATGLGSATWEVTHGGWVAGAGIEGAITRNVSWKVEYLHLDTGTFTTNVFGVVPASVRLTDDVARGGVNWRF
jgi:outer membrane immunogenic protein